jgi:hypothetical protein
MSPRDRECREIKNRQWTRIDANNTQRQRYRSGRRRSSELLEALKAVNENAMASRVAYVTNVPYKNSMNLLGCKTWAAMANIHERRIRVGLK